MGRHIKSRLDLLHTNVKTKVEQNLQRQKLNHDKFTKDHVFGVNDKVFVKNHQGTPTWLEGIVTGITGPLSWSMMVQ